MLHQEGEKLGMIFLIATRRDSTMADISLGHRNGVYMPIGVVVAETAGRLEQIVEEMCDVRFVWFKELRGDGGFFEDEEAGRTYTSNSWFEQQATSSDWYAFEEACRRLEGKVLHRKPAVV